MSYSHIIKPKPQKKEDVSTKKINSTITPVNNIHLAPNNIHSFIRVTHQSINHAWKHTILQSTVQASCLDHSHL